MKTYTFYIVALGLRLSYYASNKQAAWLELCHEHGISSSLKHVCMGINL
jgi:hypothetical protein